MCGRCEAVKQHIPNAEGLNLTPQGVLDWLYILCPWLQHIVPATVHGKHRTVTYTGIPQSSLHPYLNLFLTLQALCKDCIVMISVNLECVGGEKCSDLFLITVKVFMSQHSQHRLLGHYPSPSKLCYRVNNHISHYQCQ